METPLDKKEKEYWMADLRMKEEICQKNFYFFRASLILSLYAYANYHLLALTSQPKRCALLDSGEKLPLSLVAEKSTGPPL
jgi:hypothetical protein